MFGDPAALADLNAIVHPAVRELFDRRVAEALAADPHAVVVYDVPLLVEAGSQLPWDLVIVTEAPAELRVRRMIELRGMTRDEAEQRMANQADDAARRAVADIVIDTGGTVEHTLDQVDELWRGLSA